MHKILISDYFYIKHKIKELYPGFDLVPNVPDNQQPRYTYFCRYTPSIFLRYFLISNVFINIHEYSNYIIYISNRMVEVRCGSINVLQSLLL